MGRPASTPRRWSTRSSTRSNSTLVVFAYAGAALSLLLLVYLYKLPLLDLLGTEDIATGVARTLCSAIGLVLAVPLTTAIAAATVTKALPAREGAEGLPAHSSRGARHR